MAAIGRALTMTNDFDQIFVTNICDHSHIEHNEHFTFKTIKI